MAQHTKKFSSLVISWFDQFGRKNLPWQLNKTPYRVWVSEIMLQQTQVTTVIPYFLRFIDNFPTVQSLANATEDQVLHLWTGLGYYTRARNLHRTAKIVMEQYQGKFPDKLDPLEALPGIGRSTAGAILALGFGHQATILDGNVKRVLTRFHGITTWPGEKNTIKQLWQFAESSTPKKQVAQYTQAMMDLGATICTRTQPRCNQCPLIKHCAANAHQIQNTIPVSKPKKSIPVRQKTFLIVSCNGKILLEKRPATGIWAKLWSTPEIVGTPTLAAIKTFCHEQLRLTTKQIKLGDEFRHTFSHFHLDISPAFIKIDTIPRKIMESSQQIWYNVAKPPKVGLPQPIKKLLQRWSE